MAQVIPVKCNGYNGIKQIKKGQVTFKTPSGKCQFTRFSLEDTNGKCPPLGFTPDPVTFPTDTVSYEYAGDEIPSDGYFFSYSIDPTIAQAVTAISGVTINIGARVSGGVTFNIGGRAVTAGDGSGVIKNR